MCLDKTKLTKLLSLQPKVFADMNQMKLFKFHNLDNNVDKALYFEDVELVPNNVIIPKGLKCLPNELRLLQWHFYPEKYLPSNFKAEKLVELDLSGSCIKRLWRGVLDLPNLKYIKLRHCRQLVEFPNLSGALNLRKIDCAGCISLVGVCPSIGHLNNLYRLVLTNCCKITSVPSAKTLRFLSLRNCPIKKFPQLPTTIEVLYLSGTEIEEIPCSIRFLSRLARMYLCRCQKLKNLPEALFQLEHLIYLSLGPYANTLSQFVNTLPLLQHLRLFRCELESLPSSVQRMSCLRKLVLISSKRLRSLLNLPPNLQFLWASDCTSLSIVSVSLIGLELCWGKLGFAGCTSLSQKEIRSIVTHAQRRILHLAHTPPKLLEERDVIIDSKRELGGQFVVIFPGNNIPKWIGHQSGGLSITIPLPPNWLHNFSGFAVGIVLEFGPYHKRNRNWMRLDAQFKSRCDETSFDCISATFSFFYCGKDIPGEHVVLWYHKYFTFTYKPQIRGRSCYDEVFFRFSLEDTYGRPLPSSMIKKCGVRLLNCHDVEDEPCASPKQVEAQAQPIPLIKKNLKYLSLMNPVNCFDLLNKRN